MGIPFLNVHTFKRVKYMRQRLTELQGEINKTMIGISIFSIIGDRKKTKSVRKLQETWTTVTTSLMFIEHCLITTKYIFFSCTWYIDQDRPILGHGTSLDKFKGIQVIQMCSLTTVKWNLKSITERSSENLQVFGNWITRL